MMIQTKKALQKRVEQLTQDNEQFHLITQYLLFDLEATQRERNKAIIKEQGAMAQVVLLREELGDLKQALEDEGLIG